MKNELKALRDTYGDGRRTTIVDSLDVTTLPKGEEKTAAPAPEKAGFYTLDNQGNIKFLTTKENVARMEAGLNALTAPQLIMSKQEQTGTDTIIAVSSLGKGYRLNGNKCGVSKFTDIGKPLHKLFIKAAQDEVTVTLLKVSDTETPVYFITKLGKIVAVASNKLCANGDSFALIGLGEGDGLVSAFSLEEGHDALFIVSSDTNAVAVNPELVPVQGRGSGGVNGINLNEGQTVIYGGVISADETGSPVSVCVVVSSEGYGKRMHLREFIVGTRDRKGNKVTELPDGGKLAYIDVLKDGESRILLCDEGGDKPLLLKEPALIAVMEKEQKGRLMFPKGTIIKSIYTHFFD